MDDIIKNTTFPRRWSFRELDFFSGGTSVKIKSDERVKSVIGALVSIGIYILLGFAITYFVGEYLDTTNPQTIQINEESYPDPLRFEVDSSGAIEGLNLFFLVTNPSSTAGTTAPYYLSYDTLKRYYDSKSIYTETTYEIDGLVSKRLNSKVRDVRLVPCKDTKWFKSKDFDTAAATNRMNRFVVEEFAICPVLETDMPIFGDDQTMSTGNYRFTLSPCTVGCDPTFASGTLTSASGQKVIVGNFKPVIENANKDNPFKYELNFEDEVLINGLMVGKAVMSLSSLQTRTDHGVFINDWVEERRGSIGVIRIGYDPVITVGNETPAGSQNFAVKVTRSEPYFQLRVQSSRRVKEIIRTYISLPDMIGSIGGAIEVVVLVVLILFHWLENLTLDTKICSTVAKRLHLPEDLRPPKLVSLSIYAKCCKKRNKELAFKAQSSEVVGEIVDKALSIEQMSHNHIMLHFFLENSFPDEIRQLVPVVYVMKEIIASTEDEAVRKLLTNEADDRPKSARRYRPSFARDSADSDRESDPKKNDVQSLGKNYSLEMIGNLPIPDEKRQNSGGLDVENQTHRMLNQESPQAVGSPKLTSSEPKVLEDKKPLTSLEAVQALIVNMKSNDQFSAMRQNLLAILQEFALLKGVESVEDLFRVSPSAKKTGCLMLSPTKSANNTQKDAAEAQQ